MAFNYKEVGYACDATGKIHPLSVDTKTAEAVGNAGEINCPISVKVHANRQKDGIHPRGYRLSREIVVGSESGTKYAFCPIATLAAWNGKKKGAKFTYRGKEWVISEVVAEEAQ